MECPHCKEEIKQGAKKCRTCGELLGWRGVLNSFSVFLAGLLSVLVSLASLGIAFLEYQGRVRAEEARQAVEIEKQASQDILRKIPLADVARAVEEKIEFEEDSAGYIYLKKGELEKAVEEFKKILEENPKDTRARKGLIYSETLLNKKQER